MNKTDLVQKFGLRRQQRLDAIQREPRFHLPKRMLCQQGEGCIVNIIILQILLRLLFLFKVTGVALNARALSHRAPSD